MQQPATVSIAGRRIGPGEPPYLVAELSGNHNGDLGRAVAILEAAAKAGADAVKLQTYTADTLTIDHDGPDFRIEGGPWSGRTLHDLYREAYTPWEWHAPLFERARALGLAVFSTPFDETAVDFLEGLGVPAYKVASFECGDLPLIRRIGATRKPMILSTGLADEKEIGAAVDAAREAGCRELILLHCVSAYPAPPEDADLRTIPDLASRFGAVSGLSDHTPGEAVAIAAVALGASLIEKHVTLDRAAGGPDAGFSLEPEEFRRMVEGARIAYRALGRVDYSRKPSEAENARFRRSLYVVRDIAAGQPFTRENVRSIRPGFGLPPAMLPEVLGRCAARDLTRGTALKREHIQ